MLWRVSFKVAKALKEAGYPQQDCGQFYKDDGEIENGFTDLGEGIYYAPQPELASKWLRNEKHLAISIEPERVKGELSWKCLIHKTDTPVNFHSYEVIYEEYSHSYEEALSKAIDYLTDNDLIK